MAPEVFNACVYGDTPEEDFYKLSVADLRALRLKGLPIRVEHEPSQDVGRVTEAIVTPDGRAYVTYELAETPAGWACAELIRAGRLAQTSLKHAAYADGRKEAIEVSLVVKGARPGTDIYSGSVEQDYIKSGSTVEVAASARGDMSAEAKVDAAAAAPPAAAAAPPAIEEPEAKRARTADGRFAGAESAAPPAAPAAPTPEDAAALPAVLEAVSAHVKDANTLQALYGAVGGLLSTLDVSAKELEQMREQNASLARAKVENEESARTMSKQITRVLDSLYRAHANTAFDDSRAAVLEEAFIKFPKLNEALHPIVVAASNMEAEVMRARAQETNKQLEAAKAQVSALYGKLGQYGRLAGAPAVSPDWQPVAVAASAAAAPPPAAPAVEVAASGAHAAAAPNPFAENPVLAQLQSYVKSCHNNRLRANDFARALPKV